MPRFRSLLNLALIIHHFKPPTTDMLQGEIYSEYAWLITAIIGDMNIPNTNP